MSHMIFEACLAADLLLHPAMRFDNLRFSLGGPVSGINQDFASEQYLGQT